MTFTQSIKTCFRKYFTFSGRASRSEYWWFFLFIILGSFVLGALDYLLFGSGTYEAELTDTNTSLRAEADGPLATLFSLGTLIPTLAAGWRRMHDSGRSGLYLLYPLIVMVGIGIFLALFGSSSATNPSTVDGPVAIITVLAIIVLVLSPFIVLFWLTRPSQPGPNPYGPNPHEVTP